MVRVRIKDRVSVRVVFRVRVRFRLSVHIIYHIIPTNTFLKDALNTSLHCCCMYGYIKKLNDSVKWIITNPTAYRHFTKF